jgi:conjugal transfer pilus assembly protein TrbC
LLSIAGCIALAAPAWGQKAVSPSISEADMERARQQQPQISDADIERARRKNRMPTEAELARVPIPSTPRIDALPQPSSAGRTVDLEALAKGYERAVGSPLQQGALASGPGLMVFVSFSMPEPTLARLVEQAARSQAVLVIRGFVNGSLKETVARVKDLIGNRKVGFQIDPQAFDRFSVTAIPTFVLVRNGAVPTECGGNTCFAPDAFVSVVGDVSLDYALEYFQRSAPAFDKDAALFLKRLKG